MNKIVTDSDYFNQNNFKRKKTAFSLVELSIVLIIIGLLVSGVVGGASLIKSAALRSVMSEARNYGIITNSFFVSYDDLPGDIKANLFTPPSSSALSNQCAGDGDGKIEYKNGNTSSVKTASEALCAIYQLKDSGMLQTENLSVPSDVNKLTAGNGIAGSGSTAIGSNAGGLVVGTHYPKSKFQGNGWIYDYVSGSSNETSSTSWVSVGGEAEPSNVALFVGSRVGTENGTTEVELSGSTTSNTLPSLTAQDARSLDSKIDDGTPNGGKVRAFGIDKDIGNNITGDCLSSTGSTSVYNIDNDKNSCILGFSVEILK